MRENALLLVTAFGAGLLVPGCGDGSSGGLCPDGEIECIDPMGMTMCIAACPTGEVECDCTCIPEFQPTLADIQTSVFDISCTASSCHGGPNPQASLDLSTLEQSEASLIDVESVQVAGLDRVTPGDLSMSYLIDKLTDNNIAPGTVPMPIGGFPLCQIKREVVEVWVSEGAPIN